MTQEQFVDKLKAFTEKAKLIEKDNQIFVKLSNDFDFYTFRFTTKFFAKQFLKRLQIYDYEEVKE